MIEFALLLPLIILILKILIETQGAINTAIVNQKYARSSMHFLFFSHRYYMEFGFTNLQRGEIMRRYWVGIADNVLFGQSENNVHPIAPERPIGGLSAGPRIDDSPQTEYEDITERQRVRVRVTAFTCLPPFAAKGTQLLTEGYIGEDTFIGDTYKYCSSSF